MTFDIAKLNIADRARKIQQAQQSNVLQIAKGEAREELREIAKKLEIDLELEFLGKINSVEELNALKARFVGEVLQGLEVVEEDNGRLCYRSLTNSQPGGSIALVPLSKIIDSARYGGNGYIIYQTALEDVRYYLGMR